MNSDWRATYRSNKDAALYLYQNNLLTDCEFVIGEGDEQKVFSAHKYFLVLVSSVFERMFFDPFNKDASHILITDVDPDIFKTFLNSVYSENIDPRSIKEAWDILCVASKYAVHRIKDQCLSYIASNISPSNAIAGFEVFSLSGHSELAASCLKVIREETVEVLNSEDFTVIRKETLVQILNEDELSVDSELELVSAVQRWVKADLLRRGLDEETDRLALLAEFLPHIRFLSMSVGEFLSFPDRTSLFNIHEYDSILSKIWKPESSTSLPPKACRKKRVFLAKNKETHPAHSKSYTTTRYFPSQVLLPGNWKLRLINAASRGDVSELFSMKEEGADLSVKDGWGGPTLLHYAAAGGHVEAISYLLKEGLNIHSTTDTGLTPLHWAAYHGRLEAVQLLLDSGADPTVRDKHSRNALDCAISNRHPVVAKLLRSRT